MNKQKSKQSKPKPTTPKFDACPLCKVRHRELPEECKDKVNSFFDIVVRFWGIKHVANGVRGNQEHCNIYESYEKFNKYIIKNFNPDHKYLFIELDE